MSWGIDIELPDGECVEVVSGHTYNLSPMWRLAGVFEDGSSDLDGMLAADVAVRAARGMMRAVYDPDAFRALNPTNGWGDYDGFLGVLTRTAILTRQNPTGIMRWNG